MIFALVKGLIVSQTVGKINKKFNLLDIELSILFG